MEHMLLLSEWAWIGWHQSKLLALLALRRSFKLLHPTSGQYLERTPGG